MKIRMNKAAAADVDKALLPPAASPTPFLILLASTVSTTYRPADDGDPMTFSNNPSANGEFWRNVFLSVDSFVSVLGIAANCIVLVAVVKGKFNSLQYFYQKLLISMAACDLYTCTLNLLAVAYVQVTATWQNVDVVTAIGSHNKMQQGATRYVSSPTTIIAQQSSLYSCIANILKNMQLAGFFVYLLGLCGMSIDHCFGVVYPVKHRNCVTKRMTKGVIFTIWLVSFLAAFLNIPVNMLISRNAGKFTKVALSGSNNVDDFFAMLKGNKSANRLNLAARTPFDIVSGSKGRYDHLIASSLAAAEVTTSQRPNTLGLIQRTKTQPRRPSPKSSPFATPITPTVKVTAAHRLIGSEVDSAKQSMLFETFLRAIREDDERRDADSCRNLTVESMWFELSSLVLVLVCFFLLIACYGIIFNKIAFRTDARRENVLKLASTTLIFLGAFILCWLPFMTYEFVMFFNYRNFDASENSQSIGQVGSLFAVHSFLISLLRLHPILDPLIYAARVPAIQRVFAENIVQYLPFCCQCGFARQILARRPSYFVDSGGSQRKSLDNSNNDFASSSNNNNSNNKSEATTELLIVYNTNV